MSTSFLLSLSFSFRPNGIPVRKVCLVHGDINDRTSLSGFPEVS